jgi:hypothetical protein
MSITTEHPKAVQDILNKLDELIGAVKQSCSRPPYRKQEARTEPAFLTCQGCYTFSADRTRLAHVTGDRDYRFTG